MPDGKRKPWYKNLNAFLPILKEKVSQTRPEALTWPICLSFGFLHLQVLSRSAGMALLLALGLRCLSTLADGINYTKCQTGQRGAV